MSASTTPKPKARQAGLLEPLPKGGEEARPRVVTRVSAAEDGSSWLEGPGNLSLGVALTATCRVGWVRERGLIRPVGGAVRGWRGAGTNSEEILLTQPLCHTIFCDAPACQVLLRPTPPLPSPSPLLLEVLRPTTLSAARCSSANVTENPKSAAGGALNKSGRRTANCLIHLTATHFSPCHHQKKIAIDRAERIKGRGSVEERVLHSGKIRVWNKTVEIRPILSRAHPVSDCTSLEAHTEPGGRDDARTKTLFLRYPVYRSDNLNPKP